MMMMMMFIPRGWNLFFSGSGTADFHPEALEKARPISPLAEIRQNNWRKNCGKDLHSTPWFAPFYSAGVEYFFSGTGTADFHPEALEKARPISPLR
jgi:hypothetical protein